MTQLEKWESMGLVKATAVRSEPKSPELDEKERLHRLHRAAYREERRRKFKAAGLNWKGEPYRHAPPSHPPLERKEYLKQWKARRRLAAQ